MRVEATSRIPHWDRQGNSSAMPFVMLAVGIPWGIWTVYALLNGAGSDLVGFVAAEGWFVLLATAYLRIHGLKGVAWCDLPVLLTVAASVEFIGISTWQIFAEPGALDFTALLREWEQTSRDAELGTLHDLARTIWRAAPAAREDGRAEATSKTREIQ